MGVLDYSFSNYKIQPRLARDVVEESSFVNGLPTKPTRIQRIQQVLYSDLLKTGEDELSDFSYSDGDTVLLEGVVTMPVGLSYAGGGTSVGVTYQEKAGTSATGDNLIASGSMAISPWIFVQYCCDARWKVDT